MTERELGRGLRALLAVVGAAALVAGLIVGFRQLGALYGGAPLLPALATVVACGAIVVGGASLLRGAACGRIVVRRTSHRGRRRRARRHRRVTGE